jgi:tricorn protease
MTSDIYLRFPHVHDDLLTFVAEDDVWLAPADGGRAWRLSADDAAASWPRLSRDGSRVAWTGARNGAPEVYVADVAGGPQRRLTYWGDPRTKVAGWTPDDEILAVTAGGEPFGFRTSAHVVSADPDGAGSRQLPFGQVSDISVERTAVALLTGGYQEPAWRKRYRGGTAGRIWLRTPPADGNGEGDFRRMLTGVAGHFASPMIVGGRLAFLSDHEGTGNVYSVDFDGSDLRRHTDHDGPYARQASTDGVRIVYMCRGVLWVLDNLDAAGPRRLEVSLASATAGRAPRLVSADDHIGGLSCDETGQASVVEVRGTIHWLTHRDGPARALAVTPGVRAQRPRVLGKDGLAVWVTDAGGVHALEIGGDSDGQPVPARRIASGAIGMVSGIAAAPDGSAVAVAARDGKLRVVDVASGVVTELASSEDGEITGLAWSPDSAWLAWSEPRLEPLRLIRIARVADGEAHDVTDGRFIDTDPAFTADGKYLAFLSRRSFDPVYDAHFFDLSFPLGSRPYLLPLAAQTPSPFAPQSGGRRIGDDPAASKDAEGGKNADAGKNGDSASGANGSEASATAAAGKPTTPPVTVDLDGIAARVVAVPVPESRYESLQAVKGGLVWLREPLFGNLGQGGARLTDDAPRPVLERFDLRRQQATVLRDNVDWFVTSGDGTRLVVSDHKRLTVLPADRRSDPDNPDDQVVVDASRARFVADPVELWRHAFDEAGRIMAEGFWVADMSEVDWPAVLAEYRPLVDLMTTATDFADLLWEVFGELGTSHAYVTAASNGNGSGDSAVGLLGADFERGADGGWRISRVIPGESSDPQARSPLAGPGAHVHAGDSLVAVDGQPVGPAGPWPLLTGTAGKPVELTVVDGGNGERRRVVVTPLRTEYRLRYQDWVARRRAEVRARSGGRLGYLHVPDMVSGGWADFHRDLRSEMRRDGLILDVRGNRGGHTSQLVVEKLARQIIAWDVPRGQRAESYPMDAPRGPMVTLTDEFAGSDGDIVTAAIKIRNLGPVVGARTWGGVIGINAPEQLVEGTLMTIPKYSFWFDELGWGVENYGVDPDVEVLVSPDDWAAGRDTQLETAISMALSALAERPPASPPDRSGRPSRVRPPLPPRQQRSGS